LNFSRKITNVSSLQFFQLFRFGILFIISICFAKSHLKIADIGIYEKFVFLSGAISFFWVNGLIQSLLPLYNSSKIYPNPEKSPILFNSWLISIVFSLATALILLLTEKNTATFILSVPEIPYKWLFITFFLISTPAFLLEYVYLLLKKPTSIIIYGTLTFSLQFLLVVLPVWMGYGIRESLYGLILISALRFFWVTNLILKNSKASISIPFLKEQLRIATPLILAALISGSITYIDGIIVSNHFNTATFAIYRYGARELPLAMLLASSFSNAMIPEYFHQENMDDFLAKLKQKSRQLMHFLFPISIIMILISRWLFATIFNPAFIQGASIFNVFLLLVINRMMFPHTILLVMKKTNFLLVCSIIEIMIKLFFSLWLVHQFDIVGVALGTFIAFTLEQVVMIFYNYKYLGIKPSKYIDFKWHVSYSIIILVVYFFVERNIYGM
jgi:hypothetical protein